MTTRHIDAIQEYRSQQLSIIESTWLNGMIPFQLFIRINSDTTSKSVARTKDIVQGMLSSAQIRYGCTMRTAEAYERYPLSSDIHAHIAVASAASLDGRWFQSYIDKAPSMSGVVEAFDSYRQLSYMMKSASVELRNCEVYLLPELDNRKQRRYERELNRS
jgi:hypothetical protein